MILIIVDPKINNPPVRYSITMLFKDFLGIPIEIIDGKDYHNDSQPDIKIFYGFTPNKDKKFDMIIYSSKFWIENYLKKESLPSLPLKYYEQECKDAQRQKKKKMPIIYVGGSKKEEPFIEIDEGCILTNIDFFASSFFMLTRYEEMINDYQDEHGRFPGKQSLAFQEGFLERPIVNEYLELLWSLLLKISPKLTRKERQFELFLTHDIDNLKLGTIKKRIRSLGSQLIRKKSIKGFLGELWRNITWLFTFRKNGIKYILYTSNKYGFQSTFFFLLNGTSRFDNRYDPYSKKVKKIIKKILSEGHKVGLHSSYSSYLNFEQLTKEQKILTELTQEDKFGVRNHYLRIKVPESLRLFDQAGLAYDSSLGYSKCFGFRAGVCYPFRVFDVLENKTLNIIEYPLMIMDKTIVNNYPELNTPKKVLKEIKKQIDVISSYHGTFVFLIHNHSLEEFQYPWRRIYKKMLSYCKLKRDEKSRE